MAPIANAQAFIDEVSKAPAPGTPYGLPIPGSEKPGRSAVYRHHKFRDQPLLTTIEPNVQSVHDMFEMAVAKFSSRRCFGVRKWLPATKTFEEKYTWMTYAETAERRKNLGAGIVEVIHKSGYKNDKFGVGIWSQNRPEWHLAGMCSYPQTLAHFSLSDR